MAIDFQYLNRFPDINFRLVTIDDAEFIWKLRNHKYKSRHLHAVGETLEDQKEWLREYKEKELRGEEYYFVISDEHNKRQGLFRLYNIKAESAEVGSWIFKDNAPGHIAVRAELMMKDFAFRSLQKKKLYFDTRKKNKRIYTYSMLQNSVVIGEDNLNYYFSLSRNDFQEGKEKIMQMLQIEC